MVLNRLSFNRLKPFHKKIIDYQACRRSGAGVGVLNGYLYAIGGHDGPMVRRSVEKFDPATKSWTCAADMSLCRRNAGKKTLTITPLNFGGLHFGFINCDLLFYS